MSSSDLQGQSKMFVYAGIATFLLLALMFIVNNTGAKGKLKSEKAKDRAQLRQDKLSFREKKFDSKATKKECKLRCKGYMFPIPRPAQKRKCMNDCLNALKQAA